MNNAIVQKVWSFCHTLFDDREMSELGFIGFKDNIINLKRILKSSNLKNLTSDNN